MNRRIVAMGDGLWDLFPDGARFGGATANFACHASRLGGEVSMVSAVGQDKRGEAALEVYRKNGVNVSLVQSLEEYPTGMVTVKLTNTGMPTFTIGENAAWDNWSWNKAIEEKVRNANALYFGTLGQRGEKPREGIRRALAIGREKNSLRILDINLRPPFYDDALIRESVSLCSVLKLSDEELDPVCQACEIAPSDSIENTLDEIRENFGLAFVVMTKGADGAVLVGPNLVINHPGVPAAVVDTVGAGDSFTASLTLGLLEARPLKEILRTACEFAARVCSHAGAVPED